MEMSSSFCGDKHEFCLVAIKLNHVSRCLRFDVTYTLLHREMKLEYYKTSEMM